MEPECIQNMVCPPINDKTNNCVHLIRIPKKVIRSQTANGRSFRSPADRAVCSIGFCTHPPRYVGLNMAPGLSSIHINA